jgi:hypothetical protein
MAALVAKRSSPRCRVTDVSNTSAMICRANACQNVNGTLISDLAAWHRYQEP